MVDTPPSENNKGVPTADFEGRLVAALVAENQQLAERLVEAKRYAKTGLLSAILSVGGFVAITALYLIIFPRVQHVAVANTDVVCPLESTSQSIVSATLITEFAKECVLDLDSFGFDDYDRRLKQVTDRCMTLEYRAAFLTNPSVSSRIQTVRDGVIRVKPMVIDVPSISQQGKSPDGSDSWVVQVPIKRMYLQGDKRLSTQDVIYDVTVSRVQRQAYSSLGLAISKLVEKPYLAK